MKITILLGMLIFIIFPAFSEESFYTETQETFFGDTVDFSADTLSPLERKMPVFLFSSKQIFIYKGKEYKRGLWGTKIISQLMADNPYVKNEYEKYHKWVNIKKIYPVIEITVPLSFLVMGEIKDNYNISSGGVILLPVFAVGTYIVEYYSKKYENILIEKYNEFVHKYKQNKPIESIQNKQDDYEF